MKAVWILLGLFAVAFAVWIVLDINETKDLDPDEYAFLADVGDDGRLWVHLVRGDPLPVEGVTVTLHVDGATHTVPGTDLTLGDEWTAGEAACLVGDGCPVPEGHDVTLTVRSQGVILLQATRTLPG